MELVHYNYRSACTSCRVEAHENDNMYSSNKTLWLHRHIELTAHFVGRMVGHTGQHSPSGIVAPGQSTARHSVY